MGFSSGDKLNQDRFGKLAARAFANEVYPLLFATVALSVSANI
jgi:hypothetical protein